MTKREEIREGIYTLFSGCFTNLTGKTPNEDERGWLNAYTEQMQVYLDSQDVVIKVEKELPKVLVDPKLSRIENVRYCKKVIKEAGCGFFEPLIEESDN